jgi:tetratricopeptide (TPR) repeat protein
MKWSVVSCAALALALVASDAHANNRDKADALFKQGKKLMAEKRYADACGAFEDSNKLDPGIGTQLNIARCYEEWGKLGRAYHAYLDAEKMAIDAKDPRAPKIRDLVVELEPNVPKLTIRVPSGAPADLEVTLDGHPVEKLGEAMIVDPGPHTIEWSHGGAKKTKTVPIDRGSESEVTLDVPAPATGNVLGGDATGPPADGVAPTPGRTQRMVGIALGGAGIVAIGISSYMTLSARSDYNRALDVHCGGMKNNCDMTGLEITRDARSTANQATVVFVVGAALVGGGAALYFLAPKAAPATEPGSRGDEPRVYLAPAISRGGIGVVFGGRL